jgi:excinuclease ABC subunit C
MDIEDVKKLNIPTVPGCYKFFKKTGTVIYIGKAANLRSRVTSYWRESADHSPAKHAMMKEIVRLEWVEVDSEIEALLLESNLVKKHQPEFNVLLRDDKRFLYIKVSTDDEVPGVFATRKIDKNGRYFGPFVSAAAVRDTLKAIRKIWPFCTERTIKNKPCFYYQINRCLGPCGGVVEIKEYNAKVIKPITLFLEGKKDQVIKDLKKSIASHEKLLKSKKSGDDDSEKIEKELQYLKFQLRNMSQVLETTNIIGITEKYAADVVELAKVLGLAKVPERIEGYDISNIFGRDAVGSMVVFANGEANKSEYKKFKIKIGQGEASDTGMLKEIIARRFAHSPAVQNAQAQKNCLTTSDVWLDPDLLIIDGGKGQLNAVLSILKNFKLDIMVLAVSKGQGLRSAKAPDKIFFPGEKKPLELPLASPALHIIKRVRDEAHRFAISYHKVLRKKRSMR